MHAHIGDIPRPCLKMSLKASQLGKQRPAIAFLSECFGTFPERREWCVCAKRRMFLCAASRRSSTFLAEPRLFLPGTPAGLGALDFARLLAERGYGSLEEGACVCASMHPELSRTA